MNLERLLCSFSDLHRNSAMLVVPTVSKLEWDSPLDIVRYPDPRLRAKNAKILVFDESLKRLAAEMFRIMYR